MPDDNVIVKSVHLAAPVERVWAALSNAAEFGAWFGVRFEAEFAPGVSLVGELTDPQNAGRAMSLRIDAIEPTHRFAYRWRPHRIGDPVGDEDETTLVVFELSPEGAGTLLRITETGFEAIPEAERADNFRENTAGWDEQAGRVRQYLEDDAAANDRIEKRVQLKAPIERAWRAIAEARQFGEWFGVDFRGAEFEAGKAIVAAITQPPEYAGTEFWVTVVEMSPPRLFSFRWHPYAVDESSEHSQEPTTLIEFRLEANAEGTLLTLTETGFMAIPVHRRGLAYRMNDGGWTIQAEAIRKHVDG